MSVTRCPTCLQEQPNPSERMRKTLDLQGTNAKNLASILVVPKELINVITESQKEQRLFLRAIARAARDALTLWLELDHVQSPPHGDAPRLPPGDLPS